MFLIILVLKLETQLSGNKNNHSCPRYPKEIYSKGYDPFTPKVENKSWSFFHAQLSWAWICSCLKIKKKILIIENNFLLNIAEHENFSANKYENANYLLAEKISCSAELSKSKNLYYLGAWCVKVFWPRLARAKVLKVSGPGPEVIKLFRAQLSWAWNLSC